MFSIKKTADHLLKVCTETKKADAEIFKTSRKMWLRRGVSVFLDDKDVQEFQSAIDEIRNDDFVKNNFTEKMIETELENIISETFKLKSSERRAFIEKELNNLKITFKKDIKELVFVIPVENLSLKRSFKVGEVRLYKFNTTRKREVKKMLTNILKNNSHYTPEQKKKWIEQEDKYILTPLLGFICAEVRVKGVLDFAHHQALEKARMALSVLKLYTYNNNDSYKSYFGIVGEVIRHANRTVLRYPADKKSANPYSEKVGYLFEFELDKDRKSFMKRNGFPKLNKILSSKNISDLESRLLTSIYWFGEAVSLPIVHDKKGVIQESRKKKHENLEFFRVGDRFLKLFTALECLLIFSNREPITHNISERSALILAKKYEDRRKIKSDLKELYRLRSEIVHHGEAFISKYQLAYLTNVVQAVIITILKMKDRQGMKTHNDLYNYLEKVKLS